MAPDQDASQPDGSPDHLSPQSAATLFPEIYAKVRRRAEHCMQGEAVGHTLQATALVHEVYLKLARSDRAYRNKQHLYAVVVTAMRQILVDHARARATVKRGSGLPNVPLENAPWLADHRSRDFLEIDDLLRRFSAADPLRARMFELDFFAGLTNREIAAALEVSELQVKYGLSLARAWLREALCTPAPRADS